MGIAKDERICIIGAGPAGLATAHRLKKEGYTKVTVLETKPRIGGLCITKDFDGKAFDLGANYVTSAYKRIRQMAKEVGAKMYIETGASFYDTEKHGYQSIFRTAKGSTGLFKFGWDSLRYLRKRRALDKILPATGYGQIDQHPELLCSFGKWLRRENLCDLRTLFEIPITLMGYGTLDQIPAPYALTYMRVRTVIDLIAFGTLPCWLHRWPRRFVNGFERFWERVAETLDVRTNVQIQSVTRSADGVTVEAEVPHAVGNDIEHRATTLNYDWLMLCCPLQTSVTDEFLDASEMEKELFGRIKLNPFCVTTFVMKNPEKGKLDTRLVNITPVPERTSANPTIITQQFPDNPLVTFYTPVTESGDRIQDDVLAGVHALADEVNISIDAKPETWNNFPYFPQVTVNDFQAGWYRNLEGMQGQNRTFYNGGIMAFELIEPIVEYSDALVERFFVGSGSVSSLVRDPNARYPVGGDEITRKGIEAGFTDLLEESDRDLEVDGAIPEWVSGGFVRNGTARWEVGDKRFNHWFDGVAMLHRFGIDEGRVHYRNRYLRSKNYKAIVKKGRNMYAQFATDPERSFWNKIEVSLDFSLQIGNNDFITVTDMGSQWIAVGETPTQVAIDPDRLTTEGVFKFKDRMLSMWTCSHMLHDRPNNRVYNFSILALPFLSRYRMWHLDANDHTRHPLVSIPDRLPSYMHSFGLSENYLVFTQFPLKIDPWKLFTSGFTGTPIMRCMEWKEDEPTVTVIVDKDTGEVVNRFELPTMFSFHHINAWEEDGDMVFDLAAYDDAAPVYHLLFDRLLSPQGSNVPYSCVIRYRVPLDGSSPPSAPIKVSDAAIEMPRINDERQSRSYRYAYGQSWNEPGRWYNKLVKIDTNNPDPAANYELWGDEGYFPSEPVFVPRPGATEEDDGVVVSVVLDVSGDEPVSFLVVLDGQSFQEIARARAPHVVPFGLHGEFVR